MSETEAPKITAVVKDKNPKRITEEASGRYNRAAKEGKRLDREDDIRESVGGVLQLQLHNAGRFRGSGDRVILYIQDLPRQLCPEGSIEGRGQGRKDRDCSKESTGARHTRLNKTYVNI